MLQPIGGAAGTAAAFISGPEQDDPAVVVPERLQPLEDRLAVVEHQRRRMQRERLERWIRGLRHSPPRYSARKKFGVNILPNSSLRATSGSVGMRSAASRLVITSAIVYCHVFFRGQIIGKYKMLSTIGSGGFGTVYLAEDTWIDKKVALKVPHKQGVDFGELLREPRLLASLNHPNIVTILTAEKQENVFFIVMEFVPGETLEAIIARDGALDLAQALDYTCQICNAVDHAHRHGVLHRDLRPSNVMVTDNGMVKVADFGTSRFLEIAAHGTTVIGSPPYMAPEQFQGKAVFASRHLFARRHDVPDADRHAALRHALAGRSRIG